MDDFGTGYSSLSYLQSFPFDKIKIDISFIANVPRNPHAAAIVRAVIGLARGLNVPVVAEGVDCRAAGLPAAGVVRRGAGLFHRPSAANRGSCRIGREGQDLTQGGRQPLG